MSRTDGIDELDPRFPIGLGPTSPEFWATLALWEAYPSHSARLFAAGEAAHAVEQNGRPETTYVQPLPPAGGLCPCGKPITHTEFCYGGDVEPPEPPPPPLPVPYPPLAEDTLAHEFTLTGPLDMIP